MSTVDVQQLLAFERCVRSEVGGKPHGFDPSGATSETIANLEAEVNKFAAMSATAEDFIALVQQGVPSKESGLNELEKQFSAGRDAIGEYYAQNVAMRKLALAKILPQSDGRILEKYDALLVALASLHNNFNTLAWLVGEHAAEADPLAPGKFGSTEELFAAMGG